MLFGVILDAPGRPRKRRLGLGLFRTGLDLSHRLHPPTHLLRAFVATARQGSVSRAATELHLTQSAVSKQVLELESLLGVPLFDRVRGRLALLPAGQRYLATVSQALQMLESATLDVISHRGHGGALNISALPTFGARWLIPRLPGFQREHPDIHLDFVHYSRGHDFSDPVLDAAIRYGEGHWPGAQADYITGREVVLVVPPALRPSVRKPADVRKHTLLQYSSDVHAWARWCDLNGVDHPDPLTGPKLEQVSSVLRAVVAGLGIGLAPACLVQEELARGEVIDPLGQLTRTSKGYYLCYPESRAHLPALLRFREWLLAQAQSADDALGGAAPGR